MHSFPFYVEPLENIPEAILKYTLIGETNLLQAHYPYKSIGFKDLLIPRGAIGSIEGKWIRWQVKTSLYDVAAGEIKLLLHQV